MRVIGVLIALILTAAVVSAQDAVEPTPHPVYPLCDAAFSRAAIGVSASPGPSPALEPALEPAPSASPQPVPDMSILDDALRTCSSLDEFLAGAALYPEVLGEADVVVFVAARCGDPDAGLAQYATCASLQRALATPEPTPTPAVTPSPVPTPRPTMEPRRVRLAEAHRASMTQTYKVDVPRSMRALKSYDCTGTTRRECDAYAREAAVWVRVAKNSLGRHLAFMRQNPAAPCFEDAYRRDRSAARTLLREFSDWRVDDPGGMGYRNQRMAIIYAGTLKSYVDRYGSYFRDCR
jgi:hypothetical protein